MLILRTLLARMIAIACVRHPDGDDPADYDRGCDVETLLARRDPHARPPHPLDYDVRMR